jgi:hypothetical protein
MHKIRKKNTQRIRKIRNYIRKIRKIRKKIRKKICKKNTQRNTQRNTQNTQKIRSFPVLSVFLQEYAEYAKKYAK